MQNEIVKVNNQDMQVKEYKGQRVVTFRDVDSVHERPEGTARRNFNTNKKHLVEGEDYFVRNSFEALNEYNITAPNGLTILSQSGYLMLVKSFTDDLAWDVQRQLVKSYFKTKPSGKKEKVPSLASVNMAAKNIMKTYEQAGVDPRFIAVAVNNLYRDMAGVNLSLPIIMDEPKLYDLTEMAKELGVLSTSSKPHKQAIGAIISKLHVSEDDKVFTPFSNNGHDDITVQYKKAVFDDVKLWLKENGYPTKILYVDSKGNQKTYSVVYQEVA